MQDYYVQEAPEPLKKQVGGNHYKKMKIQPAEYIHANNIGFLEGEAISYISRWKDKNGIQDIEKAIHVLQILVQLEKAKNAPVMSLANNSQTTIGEAAVRNQDYWARIWEAAQRAQKYSPPITGCCKKDK